MPLKIIASKSSSVGSYIMVLLLRYSNFFIFYLISNLSCFNSLKYFTNFKTDDSVHNLWTIKDYVTLANDLKGNLENSFTICSSVFIKFWATRTSVIGMLKEDGDHWFNLEVGITSRNYRILSEHMEIWYYNPVTGNHEKEIFRDTFIPIVPSSWYHICMGLDSDSGLLRIVINGLEIISQEKEYLRNTTSLKPRSLDGKIVALKGHVGFWYQQRATFSNMNIFSSIMSVEAMVNRTSGGETCNSPGNYLRLYSYLSL